MDPVALGGGSLDKETIMLPSSISVYVGNASLATQKSLLEAIADDGNKAKQSPMNGKWPNAAAWPKTSIARTRW
jgi:hypothetical protein